MSDQIISRIDDMSARIDDLEHNINDLMSQAGQNTPALEKDNWVMKIISCISFMWCQVFTVYLSLIEKYLILSIIPDAQKNADLWFFMKTIPSLWFVDSKQCWSLIGWK